MFTRITLVLFLLVSLEAATQSDYLPYGVMRVNEHIVADQSEILVGEWLGYIVSACDSNYTRFLHMRWRLSESDKEYLQEFRYPDSLLPEAHILHTLAWFILLDTTNGYRIFQTHGSNSPQTIPINSDLMSLKAQRRRLEYLLNLPVTGISFAQAQAFYRWRTEIDSIYAFNMGEPHYSFRLPTIAEFNMINQQCDSVVRQIHNNAVLFRDRMGPSGFNYWNVPIEQLNKSSIQNDVQYAWNFRPDSLGLYGIQGNAAEMASREGAACGGSYFQYALESYHYHFQIYEHPERWLGFRCVGSIQN